MGTCKLPSRSNGNPALTLYLVQAANSGRARALAQRGLANCEAVEVWEGDGLLFMVGEKSDGDCGR